MTKKAAAVQPMSGRVPWKFLSFLLEVEYQINPFHVEKNENQNEQAIDKYWNKKFLKSQIFWR